MRSIPAPSASGDSDRTQVRDVEVNVAGRDCILPQPAIEQITVFLPAQVLHQMRRVCLAFRNVMDDARRTPERTLVIDRLPTDPAGVIDIVATDLVFNAGAVAEFNVLWPEQKVKALRLLAQKYPHAKIHLSGADVNAVGSELHPITSLHVAVFNDDMRVIRILLANGANPNVRDESGFSPLHEAIDRNNVAIVHTLLRHGADRHFSTYDGRTPLMLAEQRGSVELMQLLATSQEECRVSLSRAVWFAAGCDMEYQEHSIQSIMVLLFYGADVNFRHPLMGATPLHMAAMRGNTEVVQWLVEHGADVNAVNTRGESVLADAAVAGHVDTVRCLLAHGANVTDAIMALPLDDEVRRVLQAARH